MLAIVLSKTNLRLEELGIFNMKRYNFMKYKLTKLIQEEVEWATIK